MSSMAQDAITRNQSVLNPTDGARLKATGQLGPDTTIGQYFETMGISWDTPMREAVQKIKGQVQNASPLGKMQSMAAQPQGPGPQGPAPGPQGPQGLEGLMRR